MKRGSIPDECRVAVESAIACGYRHIDTASFYKNEEEIGQGIDNVIKKGLVTREELFVTTKVSSSNFHFHVSITVQYCIYFIY